MSVFYEKKKKKSRLKYKYILAKLNKFGMHIYDI